MKQKKTLYLDTSIPSALLDERTPERQLLTQLFWKKLADFDVYISDVTIKEINQTINPQKKDQLLTLVKNFSILPRTPQSDALSVKYVEQKIIPQTYLADAYHLAIACVNGISFIISWNFEHLVNIKTRQMVNLVNLREGYNSVEIIPPPELA